MSSSEAITALIGSELIDAEGKPFVLPELPANGALGIYFSAHWCPPCRSFTPKLAEFYRKFKATEAGSRLEIVFASSDQDQESFTEYHREMPWPALPFSDRTRKEKLSKKFKVRGIPTLVFIDPQTGKMITDSGRESVAKDPEGKDFPWRPVPVSQLLADGKLLKGSEEVDAKVALEGKVKGIYFSAHWCPPCRAFTPQLVETYNKVKAAGKNLEIVFVSSDHDADGMKEYYAEMPWLAVPYDDPRQDQLSTSFGVSGIPTLVLLDENDEVITTEGRLAVGADKEAAKFPWYPEPLQELSSDTAGPLNTSPCLIIMTDNKDELVAQAKTLLEPIAKEYRTEVKNAKDEIPDLHFFYEGPESTDIVTQLKQFLAAGPDDDEDESQPKPAKPQPRYVVLDIGEQQFYQVTWSGDAADDPLATNGEATLKQVVDDVRNGKLEFKPIGA